ncbi:unnamed protein product [Rhizopus stolonifer]
MYSLHYDVSEDIFNISGENELNSLVTHSSSNKSQKTIQNKRMGTLPATKSNELYLLEKFTSPNLGSNRITMCSAKMEHQPESNRFYKGKSSTNSHLNRGDPGFSEQTPLEKEETNSHISKKQKTNYKSRYFKHRVKEDIVELHDQEKYAIENALLGCTPAPQPRAIIFPDQCYETPSYAHVKSPPGSRYIHWQIDDDSSDDEPSIF